MTVHISQRPSGDPNNFDERLIWQEFNRCSSKEPQTPYGFIYWLANYAKVFNNDAREFVYFIPWQSERARALGYDDQASMAQKMLDENRFITVKARQVGATTEIILYFLWEALFHPTAFILLLSRGDLEAKELLKRIKAIYAQLPRWMHVTEVETDSKTQWKLSNDSEVVSLSTRRGDSYSATHCLIDEAALLYRANTSLGQVLLNLEPTVGQLGKLFIISKVDKSRTESTFVNMYNAALTGDSTYIPAFIPYYVVPGRNQAWYNKQVIDSESVNGTLDAVYESYPETPEQAMSPKSSNKRLAQTWLGRCYKQNKPIDNDEVVEEIDVPGLIVYKKPDETHRYIITADPSEGMPTSDPASITVMDRDTKEEVAVWAGIAEPSIMGWYIDKIGIWYNTAVVLFELNQHGQALKLWLRDNSRLRLLKGWAVKRSTRKIGWEQNMRTKPLMYDSAAKVLMNGECVINHPTTYAELASIESATLKAPKGQHDDQATTFALALAGIELCISIDFEIDFVKV